VTGPEPGAGPAAGGSGTGGPAVAAHPAVDVVTAKVAVVLQDRPVVPLSAWLADAVRACAGSGRGLQVVTPPGSRLTTPLRFALDGPATRWVVRDGGGASHDGLTGRRLRWDGEAFSPTPPDPGGGPALAPGFADPGAPAARRLVLDVRLRHPATATARLGGALEAFCEALTGEPPRGWGTAEPATEPWDRDDLTAFARRRAPAPTLLVAVGGGERPAVGTVRVQRAASGVDEAVTLVVGGAGEPPLAALPRAAEALAAAEPLVSLLAQVSPGPADATWAPRLTGLPVPVGMAVGPDEVARLGLAHALAAPVPAAHRLGGPVRPAVWLQLGDGSTPAGWEHLTAAMHHLGAAPPVRPPAPPG
jgi:uncharacterized protein DUF6177